MSVPFLRSQAEQFAKTGKDLPGQRFPALAHARQQALRASLAQGLPTGKVESWRYTPLRTLEERSFHPWAGLLTGEPPVAQWDIPAADCCLVFVNGVFCADRSRLPSTTQGAIRLEPLSQWLVQAPAEAVLALTELDAGHDALLQLNRALFSEGAYLRIAEGACLQQPIHLVFAGAPADRDLAVHVRNRIEVGAGAQAAVIEHYVPGAHAHLHNTFNQWLVGADARLRHARIQHASERAASFLHDRFQLEGGAEVRAYELEQGGVLSRTSQVYELRGAGACVRLRGLTACQERRRQARYIEVEHQAPATRSDLRWHSVADHQAQASVCGHVRVLPGADGSDTGFFSKSLLLSALAEIDSKPVLEILTDDVQARHGATMGQLDEAALFYLRARGIPAAQARAMLVEAFAYAPFADAEQAVPDWAHSVRAYLAQRFPG